MSTIRLHEITSQVSMMRLCSNLAIKPVLYEDVPVKKVVTEINQVMKAGGLPFAIKYEGERKINYLRFEEERLDRVLYILSCLIPIKLN